MRLSSAAMFVADRVSTTAATSSANPGALFMASVATAFNLEALEMDLPDLSKRSFASTELICAICNGHIALQRRDATYCICPECGLEVKNEADYIEYSTDVFETGNISNHGPLYISGASDKRTREMSNMLMNVSTKDSPYYKKARLEKKIHNWIYSINESIVPKDVVARAIEVYGEIQNCAIVKRGDQLNGILAAIIHIECANADVVRSRSCIAKIAGITNPQLNTGFNKFMEIGMECGMDIKLPTPTSEQYVDQFFEALGLSAYDAYRGFVLELIEATSADIIAINENNMVLTTRCAGAVAVLCMQLGLPITREAIETACGVSKSTFMRYVNMCITYRRMEHMKPIFKKWNVPKLRKKSKLSSQSSIA